MQHSRLIQILLMGWVIAFSGSFVAYRLTAPSDFGFTAGLNRLEVFFSWQAVALVLAILCLAMSRKLAKGQLLRRLGSVPLGITVLAVLALVGFILWMSFMQPDVDPAADPSLTPKPVTATTDTPQEKSLK